MSELVVSNKKQDLRMLQAIVATTGVVTAVSTTAFAAVTTLGISSGLASNLYFALNALSWAGLAASVVASFGLGTALAGTIFGLAKRWALKQFVAW